MSFVTLNDIEVRYDKKTAILKELNLAIEKGELVSLLGPSGCGKTTTLRVIAGLLDPWSGQFLLDEKDMTHVPVHKRNFGIVFQSYALFPHLTIKENIAFGLKMKKVSKKEIEEKVVAMMKIVGLESLGDRYPKQLSGGQRQRVALARALVFQPDLLLLDEPLSNLDAKLRIQMRMEIKRIQQELGITTVFVTHDQEECFSISDKVAVMNKGIIEQFDTPENIYRYPKTEFVARFIGFENFFSLEKKADNLFQSTDGETFTVDSKKEITKGTATIRPTDVKIVSEKKENTIAGEILVRTFLGQSYQYEVQTSLGKFLVNDAGEKKLHVKDTIFLEFPSQKIILLEK